MKLSEKEKEDKLRLIMELLNHVGKNNVISMSELCLKLYGDSSGYNTRLIRKLVRFLRSEGVPVCSSFSKNFGGYWIAVGNDLERFCEKFRKAAIEKLRIEAKLRRQTLPELLGQIQLEVTSC